MLTDTRSWGEGGMGRFPLTWGSESPKKIQEKTLWNEKLPHAIKRV